jgi:hypothetical protein
VGWVDALRIVAGMQEHLISRDFSFVNHVGNPMRSVGFSKPVDLAIAVLVEGTEPFPATVGYHFVSRLKAAYELGIEHDPK